MKRHSFYKTLPGKGITTAIAVIIMVTGMAARLMAMACSGVPLAITGTVVDAENGEPLFFTHVVLMDSIGSGQLGGTVSQLDGSFRLVYHGGADVGTGCTGQTYTLRFSAMGYQPLARIIISPESGVIDLEDIRLSQKVMEHDEILFIGRQVRARSEAGGTTFYPDETMYTVSSTGTDILKLIPGVQVDILQNISLEGSRNPLIYVDGIERDRQYVSQLQAGQIEKVEVMTNPPAQYQAEASGVIHIVTRRDRDRSVHGHAEIELPTTDSEIYLFPAYSFHYGSGKIDLFTSYNGEFSYFDIIESHDRTLQDDSGSSTWSSRQDVRQKNWSHRFHYGMNYQGSDRSRLAVYGWMNPYSWEQDGSAELTGRYSGGELWRADKLDDDRNFAGFHSMNYRFKPSEEGGHILSLDASYYHLTTTNSTLYTNEATGFQLRNRTRPKQHAARMKLDYEWSPDAPVQLGSGVHLLTRSTEDREPEGFAHQQDSYSGYLNIGYQVMQYDMQAGVRMEHIRLNADVSGPEFRTGRSYLFPNLSVSRSFPTFAGRLQLTYRKSVRYPHIYQLTNSESAMDPLSVHSGNPSLVPEQRHDLGLAFSKLFNNSYTSAQWFYHRRTDAIEPVSRMNRDGLFETGTYNAGTVHQYGIQLSGAFDLGGKAGLQPYLKLYEANVIPNTIASEYGAMRSRYLEMALGLTGYATFPRGFSGMFMISHGTPWSGVQQRQYEGTLYFISVEKAITQDLKAGLTSGMPFAKTVTYQGSEIAAYDFQSRAEGNISMTTIPLWVTISWQFAAGSKRKSAHRTDDDMHHVPTRGF
ncbi:TonB-dependent receptor [Balneolales bacterium ANBcel1]|nr:TonB-dependent receptor [Balneolales bacterium ANBcel1]